MILPSLRGVVLLAVLFRLIQSFNQFDLVYTITNGGPGTSTETLATEVYGNAFVLFETGRASALATFATFVIIVLVRLYFQALRQWDPGYAEASTAERAEVTAHAGPRPAFVLSWRARWLVITAVMPLAALLIVGAPYLLIHYRVYPRLLVFPPAPGTAAAVEGWTNLETVAVASADFPTSADGFGWIAATPGRALARDRRAGAKALGNRGGRRQSAGTAADPGGAAGADPTLLPPHSGDCGSSAGDGGMVAATEFAPEPIDRCVPADRRRKQAAAP